MERRKFLQASSIAGIGMSLPVMAAPNKTKPTLKKEHIKIGVIGTGLRGQGHVKLLAEAAETEVVAICDIDERMINTTLNLLNKENAPIPKVYKNGPKDYMNMLTKESLDAVIIATPWRWHVPMAVASLKQNIYTGLEVSGASSIEECWELVRAQENSSTHLYFLENVCFRRDVLAVLKMVREGLFGELLHCEGGYQHDLRGVKFNDGKTPYNSGVEFGEKAYSEAKWRTKHSVFRNGDLYPTHGLGPIAQYLNLNKGNRMTHLTSMASGSRGLHDYIINHPSGGNDHPNAKVDFKLGDKVTTMIRTANDQTIVLHHDTNLPRPYSLAFRVQGSKGIWMKDGNQIHIEGISQAHRWESSEPYLKDYDHPLWVKKEEEAKGAGHGGMDFFLMQSFIQHALRNKVPPFDVYDAAAWMAVTPLSEASIKAGSCAVPFPDFTNGRWIDRENTFGYSEDY